MECRICFEIRNQKNMIAPCKCSGTSKWVHRQCIEKWIAECDNIEAKLKCMECHNKYKYEIKGLTALFNQFNKYKLIISPAILPIIFLILIIVFVLGGDNKKMDKSFLEIKKTLLKIFYWCWCGILLLIELYTFYLSYYNHLLLNFIYDSFNLRYAALIFGIVINYLINCHWNISFGLIIMFIYLLMDLESIIIIATKNKKKKFLKDLSKEDIESQ